MGLNCKVVAAVGLDICSWGSFLDGARSINTNVTVRAFRVESQEDLSYLQCVCLGRSMCCRSVSNYSNACNECGSSTKGSRARKDVGEDDKGVALPARVSPTETAVNRRDY